MLKNQLRILCGENGYETLLDGDNFTIHVKVALTTKKLKGEVEKLCNRVVPLNLFINVTLMYNTQSLLSPYTHNYLHLYTHQQLRDEPFEK